MKTNPHSIDRSSPEGAASFLTALLTQASPTLKVGLRDPHLPEAILSMTGHSVWTLVKHHEWQDKQWPLALLQKLLALPRKATQDHLLTDHPSLHPAMCVLCEKQSDADWLNENGITASFEWAHSGTLWQIKLVCPPYSSGWRNSDGGYSGQRSITSPCGRTVRYVLAAGAGGMVLPTDGRCYCRVETPTNSPHPLHLRQPQ